MRPTTRLAGMAGAVVLAGGAFAATADAHTVTAEVTCDGYTAQLRGFPQGPDGLSEGFGVVRVFVDNHLALENTLPAVIGDWFIGTDVVPATGTAHHVIVATRVDAPDEQSPFAVVQDAMVGPCAPPPGSVPPPETVVPPTTTPSPETNPPTPAEPPVVTRNPQPRYGKPGRVTCALIPRRAGRRWFVGPHGGPGYLGIRCPLPARLRSRTPVHVAVAGSLS